MFKKLLHKIWVWYMIKKVYGTKEAYHKDTYEYYQDLRQSRGY